MPPSIVTFDGRTGRCVPPAAEVAFDMHDIRFTAPKDAEDRGDSKVCTARAYVLPGKGALRISVVNATVEKLTHSRRDAHTLFVCNADARGRRDDFAAFMRQLDVRVLEVAQGNTDAWFMHKMNADLVEEYYRGCAAATASRFVLQTEALQPELLAPRPPGATFDMQLQLVGLQFRPQYFTCVWKVASVRASPPSEETEEEQDRPDEDDDEDEDAFAVSPRPARRDRRHTPMFVMDPEEGDDAYENDDDDDDGFGPTAEERAEIRQGLMSRLMRLESDQQGRVEALRGMIRAIDSAPAEDLGVLGSVEEQLQVWGGPS